LDRHIVQGPASFSGKTRMCGIPDKSAITQGGTAQGHYRASPSSSPQVGMGDFHALRFRRFQLL
jgi:hypothetical protein